jgi:hypothetical protein
VSRPGYFSYESAARIESYELLHYLEKCLEVYRSETSSELSQLVYDLYSVNCCR